MPFGHPVKDFVADLFQMSGYTRDGRSQAGAESIFGWCCGAKSERDWRAEFLACGLPVVEPPVTDVWVGIDAINDLFKSQRLVIHDCCPQLLAEIPDYRRVRARDGYFTDNIEDKDRYHSNDSLRYLVVYIMEAPEEEQIIIPYEEIDARF